MDLCSKGISVTEHVRVDQSYLYAHVLNVGQVMDRQSVNTGGVNINVGSGLYEIVLAQGELHKKVL